MSKEETIEQQVKNATWIAEKVYLDKDTQKLYLWLKTNVKYVDIFTEDERHFGIDLTSPQSKPTK